MKSLSCYFSATSFLLIANQRNSNDDLWTHIFIKATTVTIRVKEIKVTKQTRFFIFAEALQEYFQNAMFFHVTYEKFLHRNTAIIEPEFFSYFDKYLEKKNHHTITFV